MRSLLFPLVAFCLSSFALPSAIAAEEATSPLTFERDVRPILKAHCFQCHGEEEEVEGQLDLRLVRTMIRGGESGAAVTPGEPNKSLLLERIEAEEMPPEKPLPADAQAVIRAWISQGAKTARPEPASVEDALFTLEERSFWSFQDVQRPAVPDVALASRVQTPIDAFVLERLEAEQLGLSPEADKRTLIRRAYFDLWGLPPSPEDVEAFLADERPDAWERLIDRLLDSPRYGERWGRHWLDVAGYADSDGYGEKDLQRPYAYKYRDWVIRAFNDDKPFDDFVQEQLAGDELAEFVPGEDLTDPQIELLTATGYLRMGPDGTGDAAVAQPQARNDVIAETIKIASTSLLGLSVGCAQCHDHRYDPILQVDYYKMRAVFEPAFDCDDWRTPPERLVSLFTQEQRRIAEEVESEVAQEKKTQDAYFQEWLNQVLAEKIAKLPEEVRDNAQLAVATPRNERTAEQKSLFKQYPFLGMRVGELRREEPEKYQADLDRFAARINEIEARSPHEDFVHALTELPGSSTVTRLFFRGDIKQPRQEVLPGELSVLSPQQALPPVDGELATTGRRLAYARHLTNGKHPLVARVWMNRVWMHHFGRGIVGTPGDFGTQGERPTHPKLLDWLADELVRGGWQLKPLHKLIMTSSTYRQASQRTSELDAVDPDNHLLGRMNVRRQEAEAIRDSVLAVSGNLNTKMFGPALPVTPDDSGQVVLGTSSPSGRVVKVRSLGSEAHRRSVYIEVRRSMPMSMLEAFDAPVMVPNCEIRSASNVAPQALLLMNNAFIVKQSEAVADRVLREAGPDIQAQIQRAFLLALGRPPQPAMLARSLEFIEAQSEHFAAQGLDEQQTHRQALAILCQGLICSNAFLYVD